MKDLVLSRSFGTHDGAFHADDVSACALLIYFDQIDRDKIVRTRNLETLAHLDYVCDVGGLYHPIEKRFDHHQIEYQGNLSSAGMVLLHLLEEKIIDQTIFDFFNKSLILGVDQIDNGLIEPIYGHATFSSIIASFVPVNYLAAEEEYNEAFFEAVDFTLRFFDRMMAKLRFIQDSKELVIAEMRKLERCLIFDRPIPWIESFFENGGVDHPAQFVIMPSQSHWKLRGIPPNFEEKMKVRTPLPNSWAGLLDEDLKKATQIPGAIFCHKGRFTSVWQTKEDALQALKLIERGA